MQQTSLFPVEVRSSTWKKLLQAATKAKKRWRDGVEPGLDCLGLRIQSVMQVDEGFFNPANAIRFAHNGAEATFGFLVLAGEINDETPIVLTCVGSGKQRNFIVGESLHDFLCLGYHRGYFALESLSYNTRQSLKCIASGRRRPRSETDWLTGFGVSNEQLTVLQYLRDAMGLHPWRDPIRKFQRLQRKYLPHVQLRAGMFSGDWLVNELRYWQKWVGKPG
jgi:hypothetical protein